MKRNFFSKAETFFSVTQLVHMEMSWIKSYPSFIKPNSPGTFPLFCMAVLHVPLLPSLPLHMLSPFLVHGCSNYWRTGVITVPRRATAFFSPGIRADQRESNSSALNTRGLRGEKKKKKGSWDHRFIISWNNMVCKIRHFPFGACSQKQMDEREGPCVKITCTYCIYLYIFTNIH